jgi:hypothetical protein
VPALLLEQGSALLDLRRECPFLLPRAGAPWLSAAAREEKYRREGRRPWLQLAGEGAEEGEEEKPRRRDVGVARPSWISSHVWVRRRRGGPPALRGPPAPRPPLLLKLVVALILELAVVPLIACREEAAGAGRPPPPARRRAPPPCPGRRRRSGEEPASSTPPPVDPVGRCPGRVKRGWGWDDEWVPHVGS